MYQVLPLEHLLHHQLEAPLLHLQEAHQHHLKEDHLLLQQEVLQHHQTLEHHALLLLEERHVLLLQEVHVLVHALLLGLLRELLPLLEQQAHPSRWKNNSKSSKKR